MRSSTNIRFGDDVSDSWSGTKSELKLELGVEESSIIDEPLYVIGTVTNCLMELRLEL